MLNSRHRLGRYCSRRKTASNSAVGSEIAFGEAVDVRSKMRRMIRHKTFSLISQRFKTVRILYKRCMRCGGPQKSVSSQTIIRTNGWSTSSVSSTMPVTFHGSKSFLVRLRRAKMSSTVASSVALSSRWISSQKSSSIADRRPLGAQPALVPIPRAILVVSSPVNPSWKPYQTTRDCMTRSTESYSSDKVKMDRANSNLPIAGAYHRSWIFRAQMSAWVLSLLLLTRLAMPHDSAGYLRIRIPLMERRVLPRISRLSTICVVWCVRFSWRSRNNWKTKLIL